MESERFREYLDADFRRLREVAAGAELSAPVPSCPGWTMEDLVRHVSAVYLHKVECMRQGSHPDPWPPAGLNDEPALTQLDRAYEDLTAEFTHRRPGDTTFTWYDPDQTVGFWIRRMAQETLIHRIDAELGAGVPMAAVPPDLAADGIDELLVAFVEFGTTSWPEEFTEMLAGAGDRTVDVVAGPQWSWPLRVTTKDVRVERSDVESPAATVRGSAADVLLWLWSRGGEAGVSVSGDTEAIALLRQVLVASTQ